MKRFIFLLVFICFFQYSFSLDLMEEVNGTMSEIYTYRNLFPVKYSELKELKFKITILKTEDEEKAYEALDQLKEKSKIYLNFAKKNKEFKEIESLFKQLHNYYKASVDNDLEKYYPNYNTFFVSRYEKSKTLFENGKKAVQDFDWETNIMKNRYKVIKNTIDEVFNDMQKLKLLLDNSLFLKRTDDMVYSIDSKLNEMREKYYNAVNPDMFNRMVDRKKHIIKYFEDFKIRLTKDITLPKKDFYYSYIKKETEYIKGMLETIKSSPEARRVDRIWMLHDNVNNILFNDKDMKLFFGVKRKEIEELFVKTMNIKPYGKKDLVIIEDELLNYKQILDTYLLKISELKKKIKDVKEKYKSLMDEPDKFETLSYEILNDIAQYILKGDKAFDEGNFDISAHSFERAQDFLKRQGVVVELYKFDKNMKHYAEKYKIDQIYKKRYDKLKEIMTESVELSRKGKYDKAYDIVRKIKSDLSFMIKQRKLQLSYIKKYKDPGTDDFIIYNVKTGDTLGSIAIKYYSKMNYSYRIWAWNSDNYVNPDSIFPGDILKLYKTGDFNASN